MPLGWRPRGLAPLEPITEVTLSNQQKYRPQAFANARPYLILHLVLGVLLMMYVIKPNSDWTVWQRWVGALLLWHTIIDWGGIMESKTWIWVSENIRIIYGTAIAILFCGLTLTSPATYILVLLALLSIAWSWKFFRHR